MVVHIPFHYSGDLAEAYKAFFPFSPWKSFFSSRRKKETKKIGHLKPLPQHRVCHTVLGMIF